MKRKRAKTAKKLLAVIEPQSVAAKAEALTMKGL